MGENRVVLSCSVMSDFAIPWSAAHQALLSMGFSWQEYWNGLLFPTPRDLPKIWEDPLDLPTPGSYLPGIKPMPSVSPALPVRWIA